MWNSVIQFCHSDTDGSQHSLLASLPPPLHSRLIMDALSDCDWRGNSLEENRTAPLNVSTHLMLIWLPNVLEGAHFKAGLRNNRLESGARRFRRKKEKKKKINRRHRDKNPRAERCKLSKRFLQNCTAQTQITLWRDKEEYIALHWQLRKWKQGNLSIVSLIECKVAFLQDYQ